MLEEGFLMNSTLISPPSENVVQLLPGCPAEGVMGGAEGGFYASGLLQGNGRCLSTNQIFVTLSGSEDLHRPRPQFCLTDTRNAVFIDHVPVFAEMLSIAKVLKKVWV